MAFPSAQLCLTATSWAGVPATARAPAGRGGAWAGLSAGFLVGPLVARCPAGSSVLLRGAAVVAGVFCIPRAGRSCRRFQQLLRP